MSRASLTVHGVPVEDLLEALCETSTLLTKQDVRFGGLLGGWSNLNLLLISDRQRIVLKLPAHTTAESMGGYDLLMQRHQDLSRIGIAPRPLEAGWIDTPVEAPYILLEFVEGRVYPTPSTIPISALSALRHAIDSLNTARCDSATALSRPSNLLDLHINAVSSATDRRGISSNTIALLHELLPLADAVRSHCEHLPWSGGLIHGDLSESNIVFREGNAVLLDLESLSTGHRLYDVAYLTVQNAVEVIDCPPTLVQEGETEVVSRFVPLALVAVISWSIERLADMDSGLIEAALVNETTYRSIRRYVSDKIALLRMTLSGNQSIAQ
ncbi:MAG: phosphotransferase [Candidatus Thorarchaeota archaeon]